MITGCRSDRRSLESNQRESENELTIAFLKSTLPIFLLPIIELKRRIDRSLYRGSWFELMKFNRTIHRNYWNEWIFLWQWTYISVIHLRDLMEMKLNMVKKFRRVIQYTRTINRIDRESFSYLFARRRSLKSPEEVGTKDPRFISWNSRKKSIDGWEESLDYSAKVSRYTGAVTVIYRPVYRGNQYAAISTGKVSKRTPNFNQTSRGRDDIQTIRKSDFSLDNDYVNASINDISSLPLLRNEPSSTGSLKPLKCFATLLNFPTA